MSMIIAETWDTCARVNMTIKCVFIVFLVALSIACLFLGDKATDRFLNGVCTAV